MGELKEKIVFNIDIIKFMSIFNSVTRTDLKDCINANNKLVFIVDENQAGRAIGKGGVNVKRLSAMLKKEIKIVEYSKDMQQFLCNLVHPAKVKDILNDDNGTITMVPLDSYSRSLMIGRNAITLRENESIAKRYFEIKELCVK